MYPTLSDLLLDLFGINIPLPIQSFGFFMAISMFCGGYFMILEFQRKERMGLLLPLTVRIKKGMPAGIYELFISAFVGFLVGFKGIEALFHYGDLVLNPQKFILSFRGNMIGGILVAALMAWMKYREKEKQKLPKPVEVESTVLPHQLVWNILVIAALFGLLGAKIFHNLENINELVDDPWGSLFSFSGLTMYGGLIVGGAAVIYYSHRQKLNILHVIDASAPALMLAYGLGRIGCQVAGDGDWGIPNDAPLPSWLSFIPQWMWGYNYPNNVLGVNLQEDFLRMGYQSYSGNAFPTPFYETILCILIFAILWFLRKKIATPGFMFSIYLLFNGIERFLIEQIRINTLYHIGSFSFTQAELISVLLFLAGMLGIWYFRHYPATRHST